MQINVAQYKVMWYIINMRDKPPHKTGDKQ